jgi:hypothetical protein
MPVPSHDLDFQHHMSWSFLMFSELRWDVVVRFVEGLSTQQTKDNTDLQNTTQKNRGWIHVFGRVGSPCTTRCTHRATLEDTNGSKSNPENGQKIQLPSQRKSRLREKWKLGKEEPITNKCRWSYIQFFVVCVLRNTIHYKFACRNQIVSQIYNTLQYVVCNYIKRSIYL